MDEPEEKPGEGGGEPGEEIPEAEQVPPEGSPGPGPAPAAGGAPAPEPPSGGAPGTEKRRPRAGRERKGRGEATEGEARRVPRGKAGAAEKGGGPGATLWILVAVVVLAGAGIAAFFVFFGKKGPNADEVVRQAKALEKQEKWAEALKSLDGFLAGSPAEAEAAKARVERERIGAKAKELAAGLEKEIRDLLAAGGADSLAKVPEKGEVYLSIAPLVGMEPGDLKDRIATAKADRDRAGAARRGAEEAFASGTVAGKVQVPAGEYAIDQNLEIQDGASLAVEKGATMRFAADRSLIVRKGGKLSAGPGAVLRFEERGEIAVNEGGAFEAGEGTQILLGPGCGISCRGVLKARGTKDLPVKISAIDESEGFRNVALEGAGAAGSELVGVEVTGGRGRTLEGAHRKEDLHGGAVFAARGANVKFETSRLANCGAAYGGALFLMEAEAVLKDCVLESNKAARTGGAICLFRGGSLSVEGGEIRNNEAFGSGGGIEASDKVRVHLSGVKFTANAAASLGGACSASSGTDLRAEKAAFEGNRAKGEQGSGGAVSALEAEARFTGCAFRGNSSTMEGGAAYVGRAGSLAFEDCEFQGNSSDRDEGGAVYADMGCQLAFSKGSFKENKAQQGGAIAFKGPGGLSIAGAEFLKNEALDGRGRGGAILAEPAEIAENLPEEAIALAGRVEIRDCTFKENKSPFCGGAIALKQEDLRLSGGLFEGNASGSGGTGGGGAIEARRKSKAEITDVRFQGNRSQAAGGAVLLLEGTTAKGTKLVFQGNEASTGGALAAEDAKIVLEDCEFAENKAQNGGALHVRVAKRDGDCQLRRGSFKDNEARALGGAAFVALVPASDKRIEASLRVEGTRFEGNKASSGGALHLGAKAGDPHRFFADLKGVEIEANRAGGGPGGGLCADGPLRLDAAECTFRRNYADKEGGGLFLAVASATLSKCAVKSNEAKAGGGIFWKGAEPKLAEGTAMEDNKPEDVKKGEETK